MWKTAITPTFGDTDALKHINNCVLPVWFENARTPMLRYFHPDLNLDEEWSLIMAKMTIDFVSQMRFGADVEVRTFIRKLGRSSFTTYQEAWQDGELGAKGEAVIVHYDYRIPKAVPIPEAIRARLAKHMVDADNPNLRTRSGRFPAPAQ